MSENKQISGKYLDWSKEELISEIKALKKRKKYGLVWENTKENVVERCDNELPVLVEDKDLSFSGEDDTVNNFLIEGDNYHSLSTLNYTHNSKVDVIYIDPPYNTGNKDFIFNDSYVDKEDSFRHSKWLSFMSKRLNLAKNLLKPTGAIFISIGDDEQSQLKMLCDEIFRENNFVGQFIWRKKEGGGQTDSYFVTEHEYVLVYAKSKSFIWRDEVIPDSEANFNKTDDRGSYTAVKLAKWGNTARKQDRPKMHFPIKAPNGKNVTPVAPDGNPGRWRVGKVRMASLIKSELVEWIERSGLWVPYEKIYFDGGKVKKLKERSIIYELATTADGTKELTKIFNEKDVFENPKPTELIKFLLRRSTTENSLILDFFAGSGTTGQAVSELNEEDGGQRQFILCTNNESNNRSSRRIATDICYPRIKKSIQDGATASSLRYFRTNFVNKVETDQDRRNFVLHITEMLCMAEGSFEELVFEHTKYSIFRNSEQITGIVYDEDFIDEFKNKLASYSGNKVIYVFSYDNTYDDEDFTNVQDLIRVKPIPSVILNVYEKIARQNARRINL